MILSSGCFFQDTYIYIYAVAFKVGVFVVSMILWSLSGHWITLREAKQSWACAAALGGRSSLGFAEICTVKACLWLDHHGISAQEKQPDWHLVSPLVSHFTQSTGIKKTTILEFRGPELSDQLLPGFQFAQQHWENCQETPQLLTGTSWAWGFISPFEMFESQQTLFLLWQIFE